jgi:hypothetical protein
MDPDAVHLDPPATIPGERPAPPRRHGRHPAAPGHEVDGSIVRERRHHVDDHASDEPQMTRRAPARLLDVVDRDVLEKPGHGVEPQPPVLVHVGQPDASLHGERPAARRHRNARIQHARQSDVAPRASHGKR